MKAEFLLTIFRKKTVEINKQQKKNNDLQYERHRPLLAFKNSGI